MGILIGIVAGLIIIAAAWGLIALVKRLVEPEEESLVGKRKATLPKSSLNPPRPGQKILITDHHYPIHETTIVHNHIEEDTTDSFTTGLIMGEIIADAIDSSQPDYTPDTSSNDQPQFEGFGGGDFGGGGSSASWDNSDNSSYSDNSGSSYDSGPDYSSSDSSSSSDY